MRLANEHPRLKFILPHVATVGDVDICARSVHGNVYLDTSVAFARENEKINLALIGAAISHGAAIEICDEPGYAPLRHDANRRKVMADAYNLLAPNTSLFRKECSLCGGTAPRGCHRQMYGFRRGLVLLKNYYLHRTLL